MNLSAAVDTIDLDLIAIRNPNRGGAMAEITADVCAVPAAPASDVPFEKAREAYADRKFWVSFFIRPCCPPPGGKTAAKHLEEQREMVRARADFDDAQKAELISLIDEGEAWYRSTPYWGRE